MQSLDKLNIILLDEKPSKLIKANEDYMFDLIPELERCKGFNQHNPWHPYDIYEHTLKVVDGVEDKYKIKNEDIEEINKIINIRYLIAQKGYSSTRAITISENIPREAVSEFSESSDNFAGINIVVKPVREYTSGNLASHILGYAGKINSSEYEKHKNYYTSNDIIGKTGIEYVFEEYLKGH